MTVKVTVAAGKIAAVVVAENHETQAVAAAALEKVPQAIVDANSVDVDGVSRRDADLRPHQGRGGSVPDAGRAVSPPPSTPD